MAIKQDLLTKIICDHFPDAEIKLTDLVGDNDHYLLEIKSDRFVNQSRLTRHRMIHEALKNELGGDLHALTIKTSTLEQ